MKKDIWEEIGYWLAHNQNIISAAAMGACAMLGIVLLSMWAGQ